MPRRSLAAFDLKAARKMRGLSQVQTAVILCSTQPSVARWEADGNLPEAYRKLWALHWQQEDKTNDKGTNRSTRKSRPRRRETNSSAKGVERSNSGSYASVDNGEDESAESICDEGTDG
jgi:hypothetical protein